MRQITHLPQTRPKGETQQLLYRLPVRVAEETNTKP